MIIDVFDSDNSEVEEVKEQINSFSCQTAYMMSELEKIGGGK